MKVEPFDHKKVPPFWLGVAVKVIDSPSQIVALLMLTVGAGLTVTVTLFVTVGHGDKR